MRVEGMRMRMGTVVTSWVESSFFVVRDNSFILTYDLRDLRQIVRILMALLEAKLRQNEDLLASDRAIDKGGYIA